MIMSIQISDFQIKVSEGYKDIRISQDFCDVTLVSEDGIQIDAHKVILASASSFLKEMFKSLNHSHPLIYMRGATSSQLNNFIELIYQGETKWNENKYENVMILIEEF